MLCIYTIVGYLEMANKNISPIIFIGLFVFLIPTLLNIFHIGAWPIIGQIGLGVLMLGIIHTVYLKVVKK